MLRIGTRFQFEPPDGWVESREGSRWIYSGPYGQQLVVSASVVEGSGTGEDRKSEQALLARTLQLAGEAAARPGLVNRVPLRPDDTNTELPCWSFVSESSDENVSFVGAVLSTEGGVLLATLEGPYGHDLLGTFQQFLRSVRRPPV